MNPKFALYIRASTEEQQNTLLAQEEQMRKYCQYEEAGPFGPFVDSGVSGTTSFFEREAVAQMLEAMQREGVTDIVMTKLDRGFRSALDCLFTFSELAKRGIHLHVLNLKLDTRSPVGKMMLTVMAAMAEMENATRSERQKDAFAVMRRSGRSCNGKAPFGWDMLPGGTLAPNAVEQAVLHRLLHGDLSTVSLNEAARRLNREGIPTKQAGQLIRRSDKEWICDGKWTGGAVLSVRKNPRLAEPTANARKKMKINLANAQALAHSRAMKNNTTWTPLPETREQLLAQMQPTAAEVRIAAETERRLSENARSVTSGTPRPHPVPTPSEYAAVHRVRAWETRGNINIHEADQLRANRIVNDIMSRPDAERPARVKRALRDRAGREVWQVLSAHAKDMLAGHTFPVRVEHEYDVEAWEAENE